MLQLLLICYEQNQLHNFQIGQQENSLGVSGHLHLPENFFHVVEVSLEKTEFIFSSRTPLHLACACGLDEVAQFLLANKAKTSLCDNDGRTPLMKVSTLDVPSFSDRFSHSGGLGDTHHFLSVAW